jgi:hypothetical protein
LEGAGTGPLCKPCASKGGRRSIARNGAVLTDASAGSATGQPAQTNSWRAVSPMGLVEAFDHLDAVWRLAFDRRPLLRLARASGVAGMAVPCATRTDFAERVTDLADVIATPSSH